MKYFKVILLWFALLEALGLSAQDNHFIYIQAENKQPFQAQFDAQVLNASASGYLMVPQLQKGTHHFTIEFTDKQQPPQQLYCTLDNKDLGFLLKNFGEKGWGLLDLESSNIVMAEPAPQEKKLPASTVPLDPFAELLALVVNDPTINQSDEDAKPAKAVVIHQPKTIIAAEATKAQALAPSIVSIIKKESNLSKEGLEMKYEVKTGGVIEQVQVLIPEDIAAVANSTQEVKVENAPPIEISAPQYKMVADTAKQTTIAEIESNKTIAIVDTVTKAAEIHAAVAPAQKEAVAEKPVTKFLAMELPNPNEMVKNTDSQVVTTAPAPLPMINSDCKKQAVEEDVEKLRKKMAGEESADDKIAVARKVFKTRCFTTEQIKILSAELVTDADRYNFFDAAYPFVSDAHHFPTLQSQLLDSYYISRFKVMIRQ